ncbi:hypothetical protein Lser_V15G24873 [Lactuca serriola]
MLTCGLLAAYLTGVVRTQLKALLPPTHTMIILQDSSIGCNLTDLEMYALDDIGSRSHVHINLLENGHNVFVASDRSSKHGMSKIGEEFMADVLHHLPSVLSFTTPIPNSYDHGIVSNFEIKAFDGCASPYLALAAIIAPGIDGLRTHLSPPDPIDDNSDMLREKLQRLPVSLKESVEALSKL